MEKDQYYQELVDWAKNITQRAKQGERITLNLDGKELELSTINSVPDDYEESQNTHANINDVQPYFVADGFRKPDQGVRELPEHPEYTQLYFNIPLPVDKIREKQEQLGKWVDEGYDIDLQEPVVADVAIEITPNSIHISGWNGLEQNPTRSEDRSGETAAELEFATINTQIDMNKGGKGLADPSNPLAELGDMIAKDPLLQSALPDLPAAPQPSPQVSDRVTEALKRLLNNEPDGQNR